MSDSQAFIDAFWALCREHRHHLVCVYPDMYLADSWDVEDENDLISLHIVSAEEHAQVVESRIRSGLKSRIEECVWWERPDDTIADLVKWMRVDDDAALVEELVREIRVERAQRLEKALEALEDERVRAELVARGLPMPDAKYSELNLLEHCVLLLKHEAWHYRLRGIAAIESAVAAVANSPPSGDEA